jgi:Ca-activated chloride channel family protein
MKYGLIAATVVCLIVIMSAPFARAQSETADDKTLSPYFLVKSNDSGVDQLPLKSTGAEVNIAGVIADVKVTQVYKNEGKQAIEAIYVFPASTKASVYGMKMTIGERTIIAKIQEKEKARQEYEQAKQEGKSASLLEQQRPNVFQMNVANIMPGDLIKVELSYTELLVPTDGVYEFAYPTVVGPRYSNKPEAAAPPSEKWVQNPYQHQGEAPLYEFDITTKITASIPIQDITCTSHKVNVSYEGAGLATVKLDSSEKSGGNRDYILKYRLTGGQIESGLLLYQGEKENFFLLMMQPPKQVTAANIPAREYIFIVDISGSQHGFPLEISKTLLRNLISNLKPDDTFNVMLFAGSSSMLSEKSLPANSENIAQAINVIDRQQGGGGTELLPALRKALALPMDEKRSRSIVISTDGYVDVEKETFEVIRQKLGNANMFAFGIGSSVNRFLIEGIAHAGMAESFIITKPEEAASKADKFRKYVQSPVLTKVKTDFGNFEVYDVEPPAIPDVLAERPVIVFGKWKGDVKGTIKLNGISGDSPYSASIDAGSVKPSPTNSALRYLWARHRIAVLSDYNKLSKDDKRIKEITQLGLDYNLLTEFTSFVAIDSLVRNTDGKSETVKQPLPLPQGVSDLAVGGTARTAAAPGYFGRSVAKSAAPSDGAKMSKRAAPPEEAEAVKNLPATKAQKADEKPDYAKADKKEKDAKDAKSAPSIKHLPEKMVISGSLSKADMEKLIADHLKDIEGCYQKIKEAGTGKASLKIEIDGTGKVVKAELISDEIKNSVLTSCIINLVKGWTMPVPSDGKPASVEYFFIF